MKETFSKQYLIEYMEFLKKMILDLEICTSNVQEIIFASKKNGHKITNIENFIGHYAYLSYSYCAICIYKLFHDEEKRGFKKLFNKLRNFKYDKELSDLLNENKLKHENEFLFASKKQILENIENIESEIECKKDLILKIINRRNTFYAHIDPNKKFPAETLKEIIELKELAKNIFIKLYAGFFDSYYMLNNTYWSINPVLDTSFFMYDHYKNLEDLLDENG